MSKKNDDFFVAKKPWSGVKDRLLECYLKPYVLKILHTYRPLVYVDCFAGKGKFDDGNPGSPLIALNIFKDAVKETRISDEAHIRAIFIDANYARDLEMNLGEYNGVEVVADYYENVIDRLLKTELGSNVFLYIDPYGIKALDCEKFDAYANGQFNTIELLINMNSFGFIREACNAFGEKFKIDEDDFFDELVEYDSTRLDASDNAKIALNRIAGGNYWIDIIKKYKNGMIDGYKAEEEFSEKYCQRLRKSYRYVLNMPIRIRAGNHSKYRMIHATNHPDGCILMAENICKRSELLRDIQSGGQLALFKEDFNNQIIEESQIKEYVNEHFSKYLEWTSITEAEADFFVNYGAICRTHDIATVLKKMEMNKQIEVLRNPCVTPQGKPTTFMTEGHGQKVKVRVKWVKR